MNQLFWPNPQLYIRSAWLKGSHTALLTTNDGTTTISFDNNDVVDDEENDEDMLRMLRRDEMVAYVLDWTTEECLLKYKYQQTMAATMMTMTTTS